MPHDEHLADRVRDLLGPLTAFTEQRMFGGLAFLVDGHISVAAVRAGGLMCHVDPDEADLLCEEPGVERMEMGGRRMKAWLLVDAGAVETDAALGAWVDRGLLAAKAMD